ncbi:MAG: hypothetical protein KBF57_02110 [Saprospiraceae bacterium]|jgi:hypothetical protein|nr:hypothetical protein [Saprospiraceae bacterium]MBP9193450.1 hypothetical protein [Saprospiraceae bacterium]
MKKTLFFCFIVIAYGAVGQSSHRYKNDLGFNVTSLLSEVIGIGNQGDSPVFNISYRRKGTKSAIRISAHLGFNKDNSINEIDFSELTLNESDYRLRIGYEKILDLSNKFKMLYGIDGLALFSSSISSSSTGLKNDVTEIKFGGGPALRLEYKISDRISLMTESTLYFLTGWSEDVLQLGGQQLANERNTTFNLSTQIPSVLFLNVHF